MAHSGGGVGDILKWGLILGGGYLVYRAWSGGGSSGTVTSLSLDDLLKAIQGGGGAAAGGGGAAAGGGGTTGTAPAPSLSSLLVNAATGDAAYVGGKLNADQWAWFFREKLGGKSLTDDMLQALFWQNGRPADVKDYPTYTAEQFAAAIATKGVTGLSGARSFRPPVLVTRQGSRVAVRRPAWGMR